MADSKLEPIVDRASWSPAGRSLVFTGQARGDSGSDLYVVGANGRRPRRLTRLARASHPAWSPDGKSIVFSLASGQNAATGRHLMLVAPNGSGLRELTPHVDGQADEAGSFTPFGDRLAFTRWRRGTPDATGRLPNTASIYLISSRGGPLERLVRSGQDPAISPDGKRVAYVSDRAHNGSLAYGSAQFFANELYIANRDGRATRRMTRSRSRNERYPAWAPDGRQLAYQRGEVTGNAEASTILLTNTRGTCRRLLLADADLSPSYAAPAWRPGVSRQPLSGACDR